ncbi:MAG: cation:proton antiporter [Pseudomonadota bacterium]
MSVSALFAWLLLGAGLFFFIAGTAGLLRFPDQRCRIHALTKADNVGLGLLVAALGLLSGSWLVALKLVLIWLLVMAAGATVAQLVAASAEESGEERS